MTLRIATTALLLAAAAAADAILLANGKIVGFPDAVEVDAASFESRADQSTGTITLDGYAGVEMNRKKYKIEEVKAVVYKDEPQSLAEGYDLFGQGQYADAIQAFQETLKDPEARDVFKSAANFHIGLCFASAGNLQAAEKHFAGWSDQPSKWTPIVHRILGRIRIASKNFPGARAAFDAIGKLPEVPRSWILAARLGGVEVDLAERKFTEAEGNAKSVFNEAKTDPAFNDAQAYAQTLVAGAILRAGSKERFAEAQSLLEQAAALTGASGETRARLFSTLGDVVYAQGKPAEAREPYMRVVTMFPDSDDAPHALYNAAQCFTDIWKQEEAKPEGQRDVEKSRYYLTAAGDLCGEFFRRFRTSAEAEEARRLWNEIRKPHEALTQAPAGGAAGG